MPRVTRRGLLQGAGSVAAGLVFPAHSPAKVRPRAPGEGDARRAVELVVNGAPRRLDVEPCRTLAEVIREDLALTGTKVVCDRASCGACTVLLDGRAVLSCHLLAAQADGRSVVTIEGLSEGEKLHPLQQAFIEFDAAQCGFCTPGMIVTLRAALDRNPRATAGEVRRSIAGNLCRCAAYDHIVAAALSVARGT
ncbi:MAG TPA: (2Fe-2S)-binding protein [Thermoanaerobaculia bacterium]|nr:(2Fe-2S)-binding protein [Thermoanaerobaculia bacterium]